MLSIIMKIQSLCFSFIYLLVALAVSSANASPSNSDSLLNESSEAYNNSNFYKSDYLIAKHLGSESPNISNVIKTIHKRKKKANTYILY